MRYFGCVTTNTAPRDPAGSLLAILALRAGGDDELWARVRTAQLDGGRELALFLLGANLVAAAIVVILFAPFNSLSGLSAWSIAIGLIAVSVTVRRLRSTNDSSAEATLAQMRATWLEGIALAIGWSVVPLFFGGRSDPATALALWMILSVLMTAAAVAMAPLVTVAISFIGGVSLVVTATLMLSDAYIAGAATALFAALLLIDLLGRARALVRLHGSEMSLAERNETVSLLLGEFEDATADWLWQTDPARRIVRASPRFAYACGVDPSAIEGQPLFQLLAGPAWEHGNFSPALRELAQRMKHRENFRDLVLPVVVGDEQRWWQLAASPRYAGDGEFLGFHGVGSDVTEQRLSAEKINRLARYDALTGLPNRLMVNDTLTSALSEAGRWNGRCAFMMIDLDRFKAVNDTLGHPVGDRLLGRVSERLRQLMTENELVGRLGGDEFAVVVHDARDTERLERLARTIIETISAPYEIDQHTLYIGTSVGIATSPRDGRNAETLIRSADLALYRSKDRGGGVFHAYDPQLHAEAEERRLLEVALREALENDEFHVEYQPSVDARSGELCGFEALLRWTHPKLGPIAPSRFVAIAEEARLIGPIGDWVLRTACAEAAGWDAPITVAINVSPEQLHGPRFVASVRRAGGKRPAALAAGA